MSTSIANYRESKLPKVLDEAAWRQELYRLAHKDDLTPDEVEILVTSHGQFSDVTLEEAANDIRQHQAHEDIAAAKPHLQASYDSASTACSSHQAETEKFIADYKQKRAAELAALDEVRDSAREARNNAEENDKLALTIENKHALYFSRPSRRIDNRFMQPEAIVPDKNDYPLHLQRGVTIHRIGDLLKACKRGETPLGYGDDNIETICAIGQSETEAEELRERYRKSAPTKPAPPDDPFACRSMRPLTSDEMRQWEARQKKNSMVVAS